jgi:signal transduction histidine kinase
MSPAQPGQDLTPTKAGKALQPINLQWAVLLSVLLALAIPAMLAFIVESQQSENQARAALKKDLERTAEVLAASLSSPLWEFSIPSTEAIVGAMIKDEHFVSIIVTEAVNNTPFVELYRQSSSSDPTLSLTKDIVRDGVTIGQAHVTMTLTPYLYASKSQLQRNFISLLIILLIALTCITIILRHRLLHPIEKLTGAALALSGKNLNTPIQAERDDEIGSVALAMETMRCRLLETFDELQSKNEQLGQHANLLESRVSARTEELETANQELSATLNSLKSAQEQLIESEKLASLGRLVAGVAHELNTPLGNALTVVTSLDDLQIRLETMIETGSLRRSELSSIVSQARDGQAIIGRNIARAAEIIQNFKRLAIDQTTDMRRNFDLAEVIEDVMISISPSFKATPVTLDKSLTPNILMNSFPGPLGQVITNIALNALVHAFPDGVSGKITLRCYAPNNQQAIIECSDNGCGMSAKTQKHIFDPFFTTRFGQGGSGLGMHIVHTIITGILGGSIDIESTPEEGSTFRITLPRISPEKPS